MQRLGSAGWRSSVEGKEYDMNMPILVEVLTISRNIHKHEHWIRKSFEVYQQSELQPLAASYTYVHSLSTICSTKYSPIIVHLVQQVETLITSVCVPSRKEK